MQLHLTLGLYNKQLRSFVTFLCLSPHQVHQPAATKILLDLSFCLVDFTRCQRYRYIICFNCRSSNASALLLLLTVRWPARYSSNHDKSLMPFLVPREEREITHGIRNHQGHHWLKYILDSLFMNYWIIFIVMPKYHLEFSSLKFPKPILTG